MRRAACAVALVGLLLLTGCSSVPSSGAATERRTDGATTGDGTVDLYVGDGSNAIGRFEHLNVTVTAVGFEPADADDAPARRAGTGGATDATGTADGDEDGWVTREVNATTVDLTELRGENATMLRRVDLPAGTYRRVYVEVESVVGTRPDGSRADVELSGRRLELVRRFTVDEGESVDFVYGVTVVETGRSGRYALESVASRSGTDVPLKEVHADERGRRGDLGARFVGEVELGRATTVRVARDGEPVTGARVTVRGATYRTGSDGTVMFDVPSGVEELEVEVTHGDDEVELTRTFGGE